jgi:hypothetical protein
LSYSYSASYNDKPIPSFTFENVRHTRAVGLYGHDSDIDGRFYIHAQAPKNIDIYIHNHQLTVDQHRELNVKLDAAVAEQKLRHAA